MPNLIQDIEGLFGKAQTTASAALAHLPAEDQATVSNLLTSTSQEVASVVQGTTTPATAVSSEESTVVSTAQSVAASAESQLANDLTDALDKYVEAKGGPIGTALVPVLNTGLSTAISTAETYIAGLAKSALSKL